MTAPRARTATSTRRSAALRTVALAAATSLALVTAGGSVAGAQPITYTIFIPSAAGTLNGSAFENAAMTLTFTGADASAPYTLIDGAPPAGYQHYFSGLTEYLTLVTGTTMVRGTVSDVAAMYTYTGVNGPFFEAISFPSPPNPGDGVILGYLPYGDPNGDTYGSARYNLRNPFTSTFGALEAGPNIEVLPSAGLDVTSIGSTDRIEDETFTATLATPEPSTWALLGTGLLAVGGAALRRRRAQS